MLLGFFQKGSLSSGAPIMRLMKRTPIFGKPYIPEENLPYRVLGILTTHAEYAPAGACLQVEKSILMIAAMAISRDPTMSTSPTPCTAPLPLPRRCKWLLIRLHDQVAWTMVPIYQANLMGLSVGQSGPIMYWLNPKP